MTAQVYDLAAAREDRTNHLREGVWQAKERLGKVVYQHPDTGYWYSTTMAEQIARRESEGEEG